MNNKRILSVGLAAIMMISSTSVFAARGDYYKIPEYENAKYKERDVLRDRLALRDVMRNQEEFVYEGLNGKAYTISAAREAYRNVDGESTKFYEELKKEEGIKVGVEKEDKLEVVEVSAINSKEVEVTFNQEVKEIKPANFKVTDKDGNLLFVSKAVLNEAKTVATLSFFDAFADKAVYSVETSNVADVDGNVMTTSTDQFGYEKSEVATVEFTAKTIKIGGKLGDVVKVTDKLGRDVTSENIVEFASADTSIIGNDGIAKALQDGKEVLVTATVKGTTVTAKAVIKVSESAAKTFVGYTLDLSANTVADTDAFNKLEADKVYDHISISDKTPNEKVLTVYALDQYGKSMGKVFAFESVENLTPNVAIVSATDGKITPISEGTAYVKVKVGAIEQTLKINVRAAAKVQSIEVDPAAVEVVEKGIAGNIKVTYKNQFGGTTPGTNANLTIKSSDATVATISKTDVNNIAVTGLKAGTTNVTLTYKYKVGTEDVVIEKVVPVTVSEKGSFADYKVEVSTTTLYSEDDVDTTTVDETNVDVKVYELDDKGQKIGVATGTSLQARKLDAEGKEVNDAGTAVTISGLNVAYKAAGTQKVQVKVGDVVLETVEFTSVNNTPGVASTVELDNTAVLAGEFGALTGYEKNVNKLLEGIVILKDKFGDKLDAGVVTAGAFAFEYTITNKDGVTFDGIAGSAETIKTVIKKNATADVVLTSVIFTPLSGTATENLLKNPEVIKLSVKDTTAPTAALTGLTGIADANKLTLTFNEDVKFNGKALQDTNTTDKVQFIKDLFVDNPRYDQLETAMDEANIDIVVTSKTIVLTLKDNAIKKVVFEALDKAGNKDGIYTMDAEIDLQKFTDIAGNSLSELADNPFKIVYSGDAEFTADEDGGATYLEDVKARFYTVADWAAQFKAE